MMKPDGIRKTMSDSKLLTSSSSFRAASLTCDTPRPRASTGHLVATLKAGDYFGELGLLDEGGGGRRATVTAGPKGCVCLVLGAQQFKDFVLSAPSIVGEAQRRSGKLATPKHTRALPRLTARGGATLTLTLTLTLPRLTARGAKRGAGALTAPPGLPCACASVACLLTNNYWSPIISGGSKVRIIYL